MKKTIIYATTLIFLVAGGWIIKNVVSENNSVSQNFPFESLDEISKSGNLDKNYISESFQANIKYPSGWKLDAYENAEQKYLSFSSYDPSNENLTNEQIEKEAIIEFHLLDNDNSINIKEWINRFHSREPFPTKNSVKASKEIIVGGRTSTLQLINVQGGHYYYVFIPTENKIIFIKGSEINNPYATTFLEMLKSISFN